MTFKKNLSPEEKRRLLTILAEMKARGIEIPKEEKPVFTDQWNIDENGYFVRDDGKHYNPGPNQKAFTLSKAAYSCMYGRRGCGKTGAGAQKALLKIHQGLSGSVINPDLENFKLSTWPELKRWIPWDMVVVRHRYRRSPDWDVTRPFSIVFQNGAVMYCKGLKDPNSARGPNLNWLWYDEAGRDAMGLGWQLAVAGVRIGNNPQAWATYTPKGFGHWTYKFFIEKQFPDEVMKFMQDKPDRNLLEAFHAEKEENAANLDPDFTVRLLMANPIGYLRQNEFEGEYADEIGSLGDRNWFKDHYLDTSPDWVFKRVRFWDLAATEKKSGLDPDETVGSLVGCDREKKRFALENQVGGFWAWEKIKENVRAVAEMDGPGVWVYVEQEPGSGGKNQVAELKAVVKDLGVHLEGHDPKKDGDRVQAASVWFAEAMVGLWWIVRGGWNERFLSQLDVFQPENKKQHDDRVTSVSGARLSIAPIRHWSHTDFLHLNMNTAKKEEDKKKMGITKL